MTKPITSVAVMMLFEEGHFLLDDPVSDYLPQFEQQEVYSDKEEGELVFEEAHRPVSIRDLLTHTSGLSYGLFSNTPVDSMIRNSGLWFGDLVEMVSGQPFDSFLRERIFGPLGMNDTDFFVPEGKRERVMPVFYANDAGELEDLPLSGNIGSEGAAGWSGINNTFFTVDPEENLLFILMTQFSPYKIDRIRKHFTALVYQSLID